MINDLGKNLKDLRELKGFSQRQLSQLSGVTQSHICNIESGNYNCTVKIVYDLSKALQCNPDELFKNRTEEDKWKTFKNLKKNFM